MRFLSLHISNFRGVKDCRVTFAQQGVTLIHGPNEVGKSSLREAIFLLFAFKASSNVQAIKDVKPIDRDIGTEIELEAESGGIRFTYRKTFNKGRRADATELTVHEPTPATFTGDEAHERADRILSETLDKRLWDALILRQGDTLTTPRVADRTALMTALDQAAAGAAADGGDREAEGLFERVSNEYAKYYTAHKASRESTLLTRADEEVAAAADKVAEAEGALRALEEKIERAATLRRELGETTGREAEKARSLEEYRDRDRKAGEWARSLGNDRAALQAAENRAREAERDWDDRQGLIAAVTAAAREAAALQAEEEGFAETLARAEARVAACFEAAIAAAERKRLTGERAAAARSEAEYRRLLPRLGELREKKKRVDAARAAERKARAELAAVRVDRKLLEALRHADEEVTREEAKLSAAVPRVTLRALDACRTEIDGGEKIFAPGETLSQAVAGAFRLTIPGALALTVEAGGDAEQAGRRAAGARERRDKLYADAGAADYADACAALERKSEAERRLRECERIEQECLGAAGYGDLEQRLRDLEERVAAHPVTRLVAGTNGAPSSSSPDNDDADDADDADNDTDDDAAEKAFAAAERESDAARAAWEAAEREHAAARAERDSLAAARAETQGRSGMATKALEQGATRLAMARAAVADEALANARAAAGEAVREAERRVRAGEANLEEMNPEQIRIMLESLADSLERLRRNKEEKTAELAALARELEIRGESGLYETAGEARLEEERKQLARDTLRRKAAAARLLFEIMRDEREKARQAYAAPLREKIEELGRLVFNASFRVEMGGDDLHIVSRTLDGVAVPFESLSGGAREQMSLLFRAACAMLVSNRGGMPLIVDDALGFADRERAQLISAALNIAAQRCQIIIFTCAPERYDNIRDVTAVELRRGKSH